MKLGKMNKGGTAWIYILSFLAARAELAGMYPFAIAIFVGAYLADCGSWGLYGAVLLGIASTFSLTGVMKYGVILFLITVGISLAASDKKLKNPLLTACLAGGITGLAGLVWRVLPAESWRIGSLQSANDLLFPEESIGDMGILGIMLSNTSAWYMPILEGIIVICFTLILEQALQVIRNNENIMKSENLLSTLTLMAIVLWGIPLQVAYYFTALQGVIYYLILYVSYRYGVAYGTSVGTICGVVLALRTQQVEWVAICVILSVAVAFLGEWSKLLEAFGFLAVIGFLGFFYYPELLEVQALRGLVSAGILFVCTPKSFLLKYSVAEPESEKALINNEVQKITRQHLQEFAGVFTKLSRSFCEPAYAVGGDGQIVRYPLFARQMGEIGESLQEFSVGMYTPIAVDHRRESQVIHQLERQNVRVKHLVMIKGMYGRKEIYLSARTIRGRVMTAKEAAEIISEALGCNYRVAASSRMIIHREYSIVMFEEDTHYRYLTGVKRLAKEGQQVSGDNFSQLELKNGQLLMMLADGMGSGEEASRQSERLVDLLEEMLEAGFRKESAIEILNELVTAAGQGERFATLDLCMVDLYSGVGEFLKMGASTTFIKRGEWIESLQSTTLPVGIQEQTELDAVRKKFYHGDMIVMVSDGVLDGIIFENKEECLKEMLLEINTKNPQELAEELLDRVKKLNRGSMRDDATVLVLGIWKK